MAPMDSIRSTQGLNIISPVVPRHHFTSKSAWCAKIKKYSMPSAPARQTSRTGKGHGHRRYIYRTEESMEKAVSERPTSPAALHCSPGANRPTKSIGSNASLYSRSEQPIMRNSSRAVYLSYLLTRMSIILSHMAIILSRMAIILSRVAIILSRVARISMKANGCRGALNDVKRHLKIQIVFTYFRHACGVLSQSTTLQTDDPTHTITRVGGDN